MHRFFWLCLAVWSLLVGALWAALLHPIWKRQKLNTLWVIGGHRGRHYGDNSGAVEAEARRQGKRIVWLANPDLAPHLRAQGVRVLVRNSLAARRAISTAGLLIYSHGEDDLDLFLILLRGRTAPRVYLDHCICALKGGGMSDPTLLRAPWPVRAARTWLLTRWDYVLCASEEVRNNFRECYPMNPLSSDRARLSGGAHLDAWLEGRRLPEKRQIYWFPTFRETRESRARLHSMIQTVALDMRLRSWLLNNSYRFLIGTHINSQEAPLKLSEPFSLASVETLTADVRESELLVSDYSGIVYDFLLLERPQILFAFDLEDYLKRRHIFGNYEERDFGLHAKSAEQLVEFLTSEAWRDPKLRQRAAFHRNRSLPPPAASYARLCVQELSNLEAATAI